MEENTEGKIPYSVEMKNGSTLVFVGLWDGWQNPHTKAEDSLKGVENAFNALKAEDPRLRLRACDNLICFDRSERRRKPFQLPAGRGPD